LELEDIQMLRGADAMLFKLVAPERAKKWFEIMKKNGSL